MPLPEFDIYPYVGALPLRFGTPRADVPACMGVPAKPSREEDDCFGPVRVAYYGTEEVAEISFGPRDVIISFLGRRIWEGDRVEDPMPVFLDHDAHPVEFYGFVIFPEIGVTCTGFHDDDRSQRAITVFRRGHWDRHLPKAKSPDLSRYRG